MHPFEFSIDFLQFVHSSAFDLSYQPIYLAFRCYQPRDIHPFATADGRIGTKAGTDFVAVVEIDALEALDDGIAQELVDSNFVEPNTVHQRGIAYLGAVERVDVGQLAAGVAQVEQCLTSLEHLLHGIRTEQVVVDKVQLVGVLASVAFGPLLCVAYSSHTAQVDARHQIGRVVLLYQVREWQVRRVGMVDVTPHDEREGSHTCRPKNVGIGCSLSTALQCTLMDGTKLIHVVALVGTRTGVHEREHTRNEQRTLVVRHGERTGKDGTCFAVLSLAVTEEQGIRSRIIMSQLAGLPHEAARQHGTIVHM